MGTKKKRGKTKGDGGVCEQQTEEGNCSPIDIKYREREDWSIGIRGQL